MILEHLLMPDHLRASFAEVTPEYLAALGIRVLLCDIDNTLVTYDDPEPTPEVAAWFSLMESAGVKIAFISNNDPERVDRFNRSLGYVAYAKAGKPSPKFYEKALADLGAQKSETAVLGDQLLTDAAAAHNFGVEAIIVPPIKDKTTLFFRAKRLIEVPYMKKARRLGR